MKTKKLELGTLYEYQALVKDGYKFARIKVNREIDNSHVTKKKKSMHDMGGAIMPLLVIPASDAITQNLSVLLDDGTDVTAETKDIDKIYVILDGQHRYDALRRLQAEGKTALSAYFMLPLVATTNIVKMLQEVNTSVDPWDGIDWLTSLNVKAVGLHASVDATEFVRELTTKPDMSNSAAWLWAKGTIISKARILREIKNDDVEMISKISNDCFIKERRELYKETLAKLGGNLVGLKKIPSLLCEYELDLVNHSIPRPQSWQRVIEFVAHLNMATVNNLKEAKKTKSMTKDQSIEHMLNIAWKNFKAELVSKSSK